MSGQTEILWAHLPLAQQRGGPPAAIWLWLGILIVASMLGGVVILLVRRSMIDGGDSRESPGTLMEELRKMRDSGEISEDEYDRTRRTIAARAAGREPAPHQTDWAGESGRVARPGYDLTGEPLPGAEPGTPPGARPRGPGASPGVDTDED